LDTCRHARERSSALNTGWAWSRFAAFVAVTGSEPTSSVWPLERATSPLSAPPLFGQSSAGLSSPPPLPLSVRSKRT
jgi:hypothetical protein